MTWAAGRWGRGEEHSHRPQPSHTPEAWALQTRTAARALAAGPVPEMTISLFIHLFIHL